MRSQHVQKTLGLLSLTFAGITCMIGSGWLFGAYKTAKLAGPGGAVLAWLIGGIAILCIALTYAELGAMLPQVGGMVRYLDYTHGALTGFLTAWCNWLAIATVIPVEAVASVQYMSSWPWAWAQRLFNPGATALSTHGLLLASLFLIIYFLLNYWSVRLFIRFMVLITVVKITVPFFTVFALLYSSQHAAANIAGNLSDLPFGWAGVLTAVATAGIVFAFHGFQSIINLAGEAKNPGRDVPLAIIFSIILVLLLYLALQIAFVGALQPLQIAQGWQHLTFSSPFAQLALALNLHVLVISLYVDAVVSPSGTAVTYMATTARMLYGMGKNNHMPKFMTYLNGRYHIPRHALWTNLGVSFLFLWLFRGWEQLVPVVSVTGVISYLSGPVAVVALRHLINHYPRPISIPCLKAVAALAFIVISLILYWARWPLTGQVIFIIASGLVFYFYYQTKMGWPHLKRQLQSSLWLISYLFSIALISYLGSAAFGGINFIHYGWDMIIVSIAALGFFIWGINTAWMTPMLEEAIQAQA